MLSAVHDVLWPASARLRRNRRVCPPVLARRRWGRQRGFLRHSPLHGAALRYVHSRRQRAAHRPARTGGEVHPPLLLVLQQSAAHGLQDGERVGAPPRRLGRASRKLAASDALRVTRRISSHLHRPRQNFYYAGLRLGVYDVIIRCGPPCTPASQPSRAATRTCRCPPPAVCVKIPCRSATTRAVTAPP